MRWRVTAKLREPVLVTGGPPVGNVQRTLDYIPGGTVLGAAGRTAIRNADGLPGGIPTRIRDVFERLFVLGHVTFHDLAPTGDGRPLRRAPFSWHACKYHGGTEEGRQHGFVDYLVETESRRCVCGAVLERLDAWIDPQDAASAVADGKAPIEAPVAQTRSRPGRASPRRSGSTSSTT